MTYRYALSRRQARELCDRGRRLRIAIPFPDGADADHDPRALARELLDVPPTFVRRAEILELPVELRIGAGGSGVAGMIGDICHDPSRADRGSVVYRVVAICAEIQAPGKPRHAARTQWPGYVVVDGQQFPGDT